MAKGLFAVYRDETADPLPSTSSSRSASSTNRATARRKDGLEARDGLRRGLKLQEKENVDPFARRTVGKDVLGKGKKPALGTKSLDGSCGKGVRQLGAQPSAPLAKPPPSSNGICTGSLRTRVLPDLPPLAPAEDASSGRSSTPSLDPFDAPPVVDINLASTSAPSSPRTASGDRSFSSTVDSGYARSSGRASDDDVELEVGTVFRDESEAEEEPVLDDGEANRRARNLTESPLAEITQAFTGLGGFSAANMSPTPSHVRRPASRPGPPTRTRSSPSKIPSASTLPLRTVPCSTTATTKRVKPGQAASTAPKTAPPRSLRL
ncbi:Serine/arginine repetitive matrix protein 2 [Rhodotorula toruloides ATCC 204091]|uniref:Serine/arginine repetitive matrix protein 2 n=1 Tax=Rhodotorula toruloides TaxID=5286 RepID=A0A0K3CBE2_RHOTO|nr:Serine/arginine repetitive matrix protein 2 [Rhodotorula toruloides ATCC 204091]PRQ76029.1 Serine/arginine repetitive matrix protein 2 [Rhodotorula toruloides]